MTAADKKAIGLLLFLWLLFGKRDGQVTSSAVPGPTPNLEAELELSRMWPYTLPHARTNLDALHPDAHEPFRRLIAFAKSQGWNPQIADVLRSPSQQREEVAKYGSHAECSWHLGGRAVDLSLHGLGPGEWSEDYEKLAIFWRSIGGDWGGQFSGYGKHGDFRHFEYAPGLGNPKAHGLCMNDPAGVAAYWKAVDILRGTVAS